MARYTLSRQAAADIEHIARESAKQWGLARAEDYILGLHQSFERLADLRGIGRDAGHIRAGYRQMETARHSIFYREMEFDIFIVRVLHQRMLPENYL